MAGWWPARVVGGNTLQWEQSAPHTRPGLRRAAAGQPPAPLCWRPSPRPTDASLPHDTGGSEKASGQTVSSPNLPGKVPVSTLGRRRRKRGKEEGKRGEIGLNLQSHFLLEMTLSSAENSCVRFTGGEAEARRTELARRQARPLPGEVQGCVSAPLHPRPVPLHPAWPPSIVFSLSERQSCSSCRDTSK